MTRTPAKTHAKTSESLDSVMPVCYPFSRKGNRMIEEIRRKIHDGAFQITRHCQRRCDSRGITLTEIKYVITKRKVIETYPKDSPYPSCLILGYVRHGEPLYVLCALGNIVHIITVHWLDPVKWLDPKTRREKRS